MTKRAGYRYLATLFLLPVLLLAGCGFHLRLQTISSPELKRLNVLSSDSHFAYTVENVLQSAGVELDKTAPYQVHVLSYAQRGNGQTQATANVSNYTLYATLKWTLETASGQPLFLPRTISQNTSYQVNNDINISNASGSNAAESLKQNMAMAIVRQIGVITSGQLAQWKQKAKDRLLKKEKMVMKQSEVKKKPSVRE